MHLDRQREARAHEPAPECQSASSPHTTSPNAGRGIDCTPIGPTAGEVGQPLAREERADRREGDHASTSQLSAWLLPDGRNWNG